MEKIGSRGCKRCLYWTFRLIISIELASHQLLYLPTLPGSTRFLGLNLSTSVPAVQQSEVVRLRHFLGKSHRHVLAVALLIQPLS